jgi:hypothetical protein
MEQLVAPSCELCGTEPVELYRLPLLLQVGDRALTMVCRPCYAYISGVEPRSRPAPAMSKTDP